MRHDYANLLDIEIAAKNIAEFVSGFDRIAFESDKKTRAAVLHEILIIGEATRRLSETFRSTHSAVPWSKIMGMRNALIHNYDDVDMNIVWEAVTQHIPALLAYVTPLIPPEENEAD